MRKSNGKNPFVPDEETNPYSFFRAQFHVGTQRRPREGHAVGTAMKHIRGGSGSSRSWKRAKRPVRGSSALTKTSPPCHQENLFVHDIIIPKKKLKGGKTDDKAVVKITQWPDAEHKNLVGEVIDVTGKSGDNGVEMNTILAQYGLPYVYPKVVEGCRRQDYGRNNQEDYAEREDFRDGSPVPSTRRTQRDFDDALSIQQPDKGLWQVGISPTRHTMSPRVPL